MADDDASHQQEDSRTETEEDLTLEALGERLNALERSLSSAPVPLTSQDQGLTLPALRPGGPPVTLTSQSVVISSASTGEELIKITSVCLSNTAC